jgi:hypothetical protein
VDESDDITDGYTYTCVMIIHAVAAVCHGKLVKTK